MLIHRTTQISESHCGPAVLQMLLDALGIEVSQENITQAAEAEDTIENHGVTVDQLGKACTTLAPEVQFWYKYHADIDDIIFLLSNGYPVGVEWQGLFYDSEEEERAAEDIHNADFGHYSVITYIDEELEELVIVDPYKDFAKQDRIFPLSFFLRRWWDVNDIRDTQSGQINTIKDEQLLFFVTPKDSFFPRELGFKPFSVVSD